MAALPRAATAHRRGLLLIATSAIVWSTAGLFTRFVPADVWTTQFWRALGGSGFIFAVLFAQAGFRFPRGLADIGRQGLIVVPLSAMSMVCYIGALKLTSVAEVMIVYATTPFVTALIARIWLGEPVTRRAAFASLVALAGVGVAVLGTPDGGAGRLWGDFLAALMVFGFAMVIVMARDRSLETMAAVNIHAGLLCALFCLPLATPFAVPAMQIGVLIAFGVITLGFGLTLLMAGTRHVSAGESALIMLMDVPLSPLWVWLVFDERPGLFVVLGGIIVLCAVLWHMAGASAPPAVAL